MHVKLILIGLFVFSLTPLAHSQSDEIPQDTVDPTAPLPAITFQGEDVGNSRGVSGRRTTYKLGVSIPYFLWKQPNIFHISVPYNKGSGISSGQGSTQIVNLLIFKRDNWRFGAGIDAGLNPPRAGKEGIQYGPAVGFVRILKSCRLGVLNANYFSEDISVSGAQLIAGCSVGSGWTLSAGDFTLVYDWKSGTLMEFPISVQAGKLVQIAGQPLQFFINPRHNIQNTPGTFEWAVIAGVTFVAALQ
jgi:hypothetical protein